MQEREREREEGGSLSKTSNEPRKPPPSSLPPPRPRSFGGCRAAEQFPEITTNATSSSSLLESRANERTQVGYTTSADNTQFSYERKTSYLKLWHLRAGVARKGSCQVSL